MASPPEDRASRPAPSALPLSPRPSTSLPVVANVPLHLLSDLETERLQLEIEAVQDTCDDIERQLQENFALEKEVHDMLIKRFLHEGSSRDKLQEERWQSERGKLQDSWTVERSRLQAQNARLERKCEEKDAAIVQLQAEKSEAIQGLLAERKRAQEAERERAAAAAEAERARGAARADQGKDRAEAALLERRLQQQQAAHEAQMRNLQTQVKELEDQLNLLHASRSELLKFLNRKLHFPHSAERGHSIQSEPSAENLANLVQQIEDGEETLANISAQMKESLAAVHVTAPDPVPFAPRESAPPRTPAVAPTPVPRATSSYSSSSAAAPRAPSTPSSSARTGPVPFSPQVARAPPPSFDSSSTARYADYSSRRTAGHYQ